MMGRCPSHVYIDGRFHAVTKQQSCSSMQCSIKNSWRSFCLTRAPLSKILATRNGSWKRSGGNYEVRRHFGLDVLTTVLVPPAVFGGLLISLWTYKCIMMVVFQNKIIYMPGVPPFSRSETVEDYVTQCRPVQWREHTIESIDGTAIKLLEGSILGNETSVALASKHVAVLYLQG